jgi:hypothetical protein
MLLVGTFSYRDLIEDSGNGDVAKCLDVEAKRHILLLIVLQALHSDVSGRKNLSVTWPGI